MMRWDKAQRKHMEREAKMAAEELLSSWDTSTLPINPFDIAHEIGLPVKIAPTVSSRIAGYTDYLGDGRFEITITNTINNEGLINFTLAHEIAHCAIDGHMDHLFGSNGRHQSGSGKAIDEAYERQADYFAACLLMPESLCKPLVVEQDDRDAGLATVKLLSENCRTSRNAAALRYIALTDMPAAILVSQDSEIQYCFMSEELQERLPRRFDWPRRGTAVPNYMPTKDLGFDLEAVVLCEERAGVSIKWNDWFERVDGSAYEQCVGLGQIEKVLTVLTDNED